MTFPQVCKFRKFAFKFNNFNFSPVLVMWIQLPLSWRTSKRVSVVNEQFSNWPILNSKIIELISSFNIYFWSIFLAFSKLVLISGICLFNTTNKFEFRNSFGQIASVKCNRLSKRYLIAALRLDHQIVDTFFSVILEPSANFCRVWHRCGEDLFLFKFCYAAL